MSRTALIHTAFFVSAALLSVSSPVMAQESRLEVVEQQKAAKAAAVRPYEKDKAEKIFDRVVDSFLLAPQGFLPVVSSIPKGDNVFHGGGIAWGGLYRGFLGDHAGWSAQGLLTFAGYKHVDVSADALHLAGDRLAVRGSAGWTGGSRIPFYGVGIESSEDDLTNYGIDLGYAGAQARARPVPWLVLGGAVAFEDFSTTSGSGSAPSTETVFSPATAPGLGSAPLYLHGSASAGIDWRPAEGYARKGGLYEVRYHHYSDTDDTYTFSRIDAEAVQHIPILRENWVISLRGQVQTTLDDADAVPYFLLPMLGSGHTLRGFGAARFRDRHSMLMQAEWRWIPNRWVMDMALFYDVGKVTADRSDFDLNGLESDFGVGVRFHGPLATPLRIDVAKSREGIRLVWAGSAAF